jgi:hypothetical protein
MDHLSAPGSSRIRAPILTSWSPHGVGLVAGGFADGFDESAAMGVQLQVGSRMHEQPEALA